MLPNISRIWIGARQHNFDLSRVLRFQSHNVTDVVSDSDSGAPEALNSCQSLLGFRFKQRRCSDKGIRNRFSPSIFVTPIVDNVKDIFVPISWQAVAKTITVSHRDGGNDARLTAN